jgi:uncharacterized cupredoxin-like copper-binding protein
MRSRLTLLAFALAGVFLAACGGDDDDGDSPDSTTAATPVNGSIDVVATEFGFEPSLIEVRRGETVTIRLVNEGAALHDFTSDDMPAAVGGAEGAEHEMDGAEGEEGNVHVAADPGESGELTFTATEEGQFEVYCTVPGHKDAGMVGTIRVVS